MVDPSSDQNRELAGSGHLFESAAPAEAVQVRLWPVWTVAQFAMDSYVAEPFSDTRAAGLLERGSADSLDERMQVLALDELVMSSALSEAHRWKIKNEMRLITASVCATSFSRPELQQRLTRGLVALDAEMRRRLAIEVIDLVAGACGEDARSAADAVRDRVRRLCLRTHLDDHNLARARDSGFHAAGVDMSGRPDSPYSDVMERVSDFAQRARAAGLAPYAVGVRTRSHAIALACDGFEFIQGPAIAEPTAGAGAALRYEPVHLYGDRAHLRLSA